jgi:steroid delta-isomerase-like uncharacterized protein
MGMEENKAAVRRIIEEAFNRGNLDVIDEFVDPGYVDHVGVSQELHGIEAFKQFVSVYRTGFPDIDITIEEQVAEGDVVVSRWSATGTHRGDLAGIPPTGKRVAVNGTAFEHFRDGKLVETWDQYDALGMMQQLGVVPTPQETPA